MLFRMGNGVCCKRDLCAASAVQVFKNGIRAVPLKAFSIPGPPAIRMKKEVIGPLRRISKKTGTRSLGGNSEQIRGTAGKIPGIRGGTSGRRSKYYWFFFFFTVFLAGRGGALAWFRGNHSFFLQGFLKLVRTFSPWGRPLPEVEDRCDARARMLITCSFRG